MQAEELYLLLKPFCELGCVEGRTKAQKIFYLLQSKGYPTHLDYFLHYYGPYSEDLASSLRFAASSVLVGETPRKVGSDSQRFDYDAAQAGKDLVAALEREIIAPELVDKTKKYCDLARNLNAENATVLELAGTILYFENERGCSRDEACEKVRKMKPGKADKPNMDAATRLLQGLEVPAA